MKTVLFLCVHNAGRSQMAEALFNDSAKQRDLPLRAESAGTIAGDAINSMALQAMQEIGIPMNDHHPKQLTQEMAAKADRVISMGCGVDAEACPAKFILSDDWELDDPKNQPIEAVREIRDQIAKRVDALLDEIGDGS